ncbi:MAG: TetR/AcrR family transcriptional regulator [Blautia sp.]|nr:TetR/AcrR family transcriptional regulator [Blautia sp.]
MQRKNKNNYTKRSLFTRQCIGDALLALMEEMPYEQISISDICKKAGISRMTFYHYFYTKADAVNDYIYEIFEAYSSLVSHPASIQLLFEYDHIHQAILFFDQYAAFVLTLCKTGQYRLVSEAVNTYFIERVMPLYTGSVYDLFFYSGAMLNIFIKWEENGKKESPEELAGIIKRLIDGKNAER